MNKIGTTLCIVIVIFTKCIFAFNHPEIKWRSVASEHFIIHFYDRTEPAVYAAWKIAEQEYKSLSEIYDFTEHDKINIALADYDDYSNGYASWTNGAIMIWITDSRFDLRGNNTWLRNVITHELTHIVTLEKQSKLQLLDWALNLGYQSPHSDIDLTVPVATSMFWPEWFAEGIAQRESERAGNDSRDARREMLLRDATLFSKPLSLAEMGHFNHNSIGNELVYNQGFSFIKFIENKIGTKRLEEIFNDGRQTIFFPKNFTDCFFEHAGFTPESVYNEWLDTVRADGKKLVPANPTRMNVVWDKGFLNSQPKISSDGKLVGWLSNDKDDYDRTDLLIAPRNNTKKTRRIQWAKQSWNFSPDGQKVYYIKSHTPNESGSYINDIFVMDLKSGVEKHLVKNARAYDLAVSPDNMSIVWIQYREGAFSLVRSAIDGRDRSTVVEGKIGEPLWYLSFNPNDPNQIAATHIVDGKTRLVIIGIEDKSMIEVTGAYANEESPFWAKDNRIYYCADYDGIFNIYSIDPYKKDCIRHTSTETGLFSPFVTDSSSLLCSEYRNKGFRIVSCNMSGEPYEIPDSSGAVFKPLPTPRGKVSIRSYQYQPKLLRSVWELQTSLSVTDRYGKLENMQNSSAFRNFADSLSYLITATIYKSQSDALEKCSQWMALEAVVDIEGDTAVKHEHSSEYSYALNPFVNKKQFSFLNKSANGAHLISSEDLISSIHAYESLSGNPLHTHTESGDSSSSRSVITELIPGIGWKTLEHTVSMGINLQGTMTNSIIPTIIYTDGFAEWQLMRDLYLEFDPVFQFYTYTLFSGNFLSSSVFPLTLAWSTSGYVNTDVDYNQSDKTQISATIMPSFFPIGERITDDSTIYRNGSSLTYDLQFSRGFPLTRYSSFVVGAEATFTDYSSFINDPKDTLKDSSDMYTSTDLSGQYIFPIARQINRGGIYMDALYGFIEYDVSFYSSRGLAYETFSDALSRPGYNARSYCVEHTIGAGVKLGCTKSYTFSKTCSVKALWDIWAKRLKMNISFML